MYKYNPLPGVYLEEWSGVALLVWTGYVLLFLFLRRLIRTRGVSRWILAEGVLICFLGGLMAIDIVPREATGAALGIVGMASYVGAGLQDIVSGWLINSGKTELDGVTSYNFNSAIVFWIAASAVSFILALFVAKRSHR